MTPALRSRSGTEHLRWPHHAVRLLRRRPVPLVHPDGHALRRAAGRQAAARRRTRWPPSPRGWSGSTRRAAPRRTTGTRPSWSSAAAPGTRPSASSTSAGAASTCAAAASTSRVWPRPSTRCTASSPTCGLEPYDVPGATRRAEVRHRHPLPRRRAPRAVRAALGPPPRRPADRAARPPRRPAVGAGGHGQPPTRSTRPCSRATPRSRSPSRPCCRCGSATSRSCSARGRSSRPTPRVAAALYRQARDWVDAADPATVWDLYCGVGGFALHVAGARPHGRRRRDLRRRRRRRARAARCPRMPDAGIRARVDLRRGRRDDGHAGGPAPDLVVVNPPRRGIGPDLAAWLDASPATDVVYSSCNVDSLARDLAAMPSLRAGRRPGLRHVPADPAHRGDGAARARLSDYPAGDVGRLGCPLPPCRRPSRSGVRQGAGSPRPIVTPSALWWTSLPP